MLNTVKRFKFSTCTRVKSMCCQLSPAVVSILPTSLFAYHSCFYTFEIVNETVDYTVHRLFVNKL